MLIVFFIFHSESTLYVGYRIALFGACTAFTYVTACMLAKSRKRPSAAKESER